MTVNKRFVRALAITGLLVGAFVSVSTLLGAVGAENGTKSVSEKGTLSDEQRDAYSHRLAEFLDKRHKDDPRAQVGCAWFDDYAMCWGHGDPQIVVDLRDNPDSRDVRNLPWKDVVVVGERYVGQDRQLKFRNSSCFADDNGITQCWTSGSDERMSGIGPASAPVTNL